MLINRERRLWYKWFQIGLLIDEYPDDIQSKFDEIYFSVIKNEKSLDDAIDELRDSSDMYEKGKSGDLDD